MRIYFRVLFAVLVAVSCGVKVGAKDKSEVDKTTTYMFGVGISFIDSVTYITNVQQVDGVTISRKRKFLMDRNLYSEQLQKHLDADPPTGKFVTAIFFGPKKAGVTKKWNKVLHRHSNGADGQNLMLLQEADFKFIAEEYIPTEIFEDDQPVGVKALKQMEKKNRKKKK